MELKSSIYRTVIVHYRAEGVLEEGRGKQDLTLLSVPYQITTNLKALFYSHVHNYNHQKG